MILKAPYQLPTALAVGNWNKCPTLALAKKFPLKFLYYNWGVVLAKAENPFWFLMNGLKPIPIENAF